jgi:predicted Zn-dependent protease
MVAPIGPDDIRTVVEPALNVDGADGVEVLLTHEWGGLTRFANSSIHQSTWREDTGLRVRVVQGGRLGIAATNDFSKDGAANAAASALELARVAVPDPQFPGLAPPADAPEIPDAYDEATADMTPGERAEAVATLVGQAGAGFRAAGAFETMAAEVALANTEGQFCYAPSTQATFTAVVSGGESGAGTAEETHRRAADFDPAAMGGFLSFLSFGGRAIEEGRSALSGKAGEQVCSPAITIVDDVREGGALGLPFDFEGTPRQRVSLIDRGVFRSGVYDRRSAALAGRQSTGHALPPPNPEGPFPLNLSLEAGEATLEEMIAATDRGVLVSRFHYSNVVHPIETVLTGMTRDGTWLIEDGHVTHPVKNLRFTQSILGALSDVQLVGRDPVLVSEFFFSASRVPALQIGAFHFSGRSDH